MPEDRLKRAVQFSHPLPDTSLTPKGGTGVPEDVRLPLGADRYVSVRTVPSGAGTGGWSPPSVYQDFGPKTRCLRTV